MLWIWRSDTDPNWPMNQICSWNSYRRNNQVLIIISFSIIFKICFCNRDAILETSFEVQNSSWNLDIDIGPKGKSQILLHTKHLTLKLLLFLMSFHISEGIFSSTWLHLLFLYHHNSCFWTRHNRLELTWYQWA
jgi:hypothetical protein